MAGWECASSPGLRRLRSTWASVFQAEFSEALCLEEIELELGERFRRQRLNLLLDLGRQRAEFGFHQPQGRPPLALLDAAFDSSFDSLFDAAFDSSFECRFHEGFNLPIRLDLQQSLQSFLLSLPQLSVRLQAFDQEETPKVIFSGTRGAFQPRGVQLGSLVGR